MKATLRIPTNEQFAFVEIEFLETSQSTPITPEVVSEAYNAFTRVFKAQGGIPEKDFNKLLDEYISTKTIVNGQDVYEKLSPAQRDVIQAIKRSYQRLKK